VCSPTVIVVFQRRYGVTRAARHGPRDTIAKQIHDEFGGCVEVEVHRHPNSSWMSDELKPELYPDA
jgi:hypothetical protein